MVFKPFVTLTASNRMIETVIMPATEDELLSTSKSPPWQTDWTNDYLSDPQIAKVSLKTLDGELIVLAAYQIVGRSAFVYIMYAESAPHSNPTITPKKSRKYYGIGKVLIAFGIKYSIDHGCRGDIVFEAKTDELAKHYEEHFGARRVASISSGGPKRYMLGDNDAWRIFSQYLV